MERDSRKTPTSRSKFQQKQFKQKLEQARRFERKATSKTPKLSNRWNARSGWFRFFWVLGVTLVVFALTYILFLPNILYIKGITIEGVPEPLKPQVVQITERYMDDYKWYAPKKNPIFINKDQLIDAMRSSLPWVGDVKIQKIWWQNKILIQIAPLDQVFNWSDERSQYIVYDNGNYARVDGVLNDQSGKSARFDLVNVVDLRGSNLEGRTTALPPEQLEKIRYLGESLISSDDFKLLFLQLPQKDEVRFVKAFFGKSTDKDPEFFAVFDLNKNLNQTVYNFDLLLEHTPIEQQQRLYYVDMRFEDRGFVCLDSSQCAKEINIDETLKSNDEKETPVQ